MSRPHSCCCCCDFSLLLTSQRKATELFGLPPGKHPSPCDCPHPAAAAAAAEGSDEHHEEEEEAAMDQTCILHMDSLSLHSSIKIGDWLKQ